MSWPELGWIVLGAVFLVCFGLLLGATWTTQAIQPKLRQQAVERRRLNEEWLALRDAHRQLGECPRCGYRFTTPRSHSRPARIERTLDDD